MSEYFKGLKLKPQPERFAAFQPTQAARDYLAAHPEYSYEGLFPPAYDQKNAGTCVPHVIRSAVSFYSRKRTGNAIEISARALYCMTKSLYEDGDLTDDGSSPDDALKVLRDVGYVLESDWPTDGNADLFEPVPQSLVRRDFLLAGYVSVPPDLHSVLEAILQHGPLSVAGPYYPEWERVGSDGNLPVPTSQSVGGHEREWVGYSMSRKAIRERNSWGPGWADGGYAWVPFDVVGTEHGPSVIYTVQRP